MYNYILNEEKNKIVVTNEESQIICDAIIIRKEDHIILNSINLKTTDIDNALMFMARLQSETKKLFQQEGINTEKVTCGNINVIEQYDDLLNNLDLSKKETTIANKR